MLLFYIISLKQKKWFNLSNLIDVWSFSDRFLSLKHVFFVLWGFFITNITINKIISIKCIILVENHLY